MHSVAEVDAVIAKVRKMLDYQRYMTPLNYAVENDTFLEHWRAGRTYNPQYKYEPFNPAPAHEILESLRGFAGEGMNAILAEALDNLYCEVEMYASRGEDSFTEWANKVHGVPSEKWRSAALESIHATEGLSEGNYTQTAEDLRDAIIARLDAYGFVWDIQVLDSMASRVSVEPDAHTIYINAAQRFTEQDVTRLLVHEIDTHVLRVENGLRRPAYIFASGTAKSLIHEEGLALYNERLHSVTDAFATKLYGARFLACLEIDKPFSELFDMLVSLGCSESLAIYVVARIKRGISDTAKPGGYIKDYMYFQGTWEVEEACNADTALYRKLYYASISLQDVVTLKSEIADAESAGTIILPLSRAFITE